MVMIHARHWRRMGGLVVAGALLTLCAGCTSSDPAPSPSTTASSPATTSTTTPPPSTSPSPTTTTSTTPTATNGIPAAAKAHTPAGAEAFVRYFVVELNRSWTTPDAEVLRGLCLATAKTCQEFEKTAALLATDKQHFDRAPLSVKTLTADGSNPDGALRFVFHGNQVAAHVLAADGSVAHEVQEKTTDYVFYMTWSAGKWHVQEIKGGVPT